MLKFYLLKVVIIIFIDKLSLKSQLFIDLKRIFFNKFIISTEVKR